MRDLARIQQNQYDLIIIGGGINGAGVARDAALRGLKTILIEKGDFASGTSSWSTRLIHEASPIDVLAFVHCWA